MMKGKLACALVALMLVFVLVPNVSATSDTSMDELDDSIQNEYSQIKFTDRSVAILSDTDVGENVSSALSQSTSKLDIADSFNVAATKDIAVIDGVWAATKETSMVKNGVKTLIENNNAVILLDDSAELIKESGASVGLVGFADDSQVHAIINTSDGVTYCCSFGGFDDIDDAMLVAYNWADKTMNEANVQASSNDDLHWAYKGSTGFIEYCGGYGVMTNDSDYYKLTGEYANSDKDYYLTHYVLQCAPDPTYALKKTQIYNNISADPTNGQYQHLYRYQPSTSVGSTTLSINIGFEVMINGKISPVLPVTWKYNINHATAEDYSDPYHNILNLVHTMKYIDVHENQVIEPGSLVAVNKADGGNGYHCVENYSATFGKVVLPANLWTNDFKTFDKSVAVDLT